MRENNNNNKQTKTQKEPHKNKQTNQKERVSQVRSVTDVASFYRSFVRIKNKQIDI